MRKSLRSATARAQPESETARAFRRRIAATTPALMRPSRTDSLAPRAYHDAIGLTLGPPLPYPCPAVRLPSNLTNYAI